MIPFQAPAYVGPPPRHFALRIALLFCAPLIVNGFVKEVIQELPMEFAVEAQKLIGISLEGSVG